MCDDAFSSTSVAIASVFSGTLPSTQLRLTLDQFQAHFDCISNAFPVSSMIC